ncbi:MAG: hypothetical protein H7125_06310 [Proteobacteria bacterium]|nr:hypothetical protein [Burkholderiales bacterium]
MKFSMLVHTSPRPVIAGATVHPSLRRPLALKLALAALIQRLQALASGSRHP